MEPNLTTQQWKEIDGHLSRSSLLVAVQIYRKATGCSIAEAKKAMGIRFRERYPDRWANYHDVPEDE